MRIFDFVCRRQPWDPQNDFPYYVHNNDVLNCCLVSKAWLKITRPYLYLCVHITSWRALELFLRTLYDDDKDRRLRSLVRAFNWLPLPHNKPEETAAIERLRHFTPLNQVTGLCPTLKHINFTPEAHVLEDSWSSWHAALERARAEGRLNIESIGCPADCPDDLIRVIFVLGANLKELTIIGDLSSWSSLTIDKFLDVLRLNSIDASERSGHFTSGLRKLRFVQPTSWDPHSGIQSSISWDLLKRVPTACSSLEDIRIDGDSFVSVGTNGETFDLDHFISELNPTTMRHLSIGPYHILGDKATNTFDRVPEHFHALQTICGPMKCFSLTVWTDRYDERYGDHFPVPISLETYPAIRALTHVAQEMLEKGLPLNANATDSNKVYDTFDIVDRMFRIARRQAELKFGAGDAF
ncbi:BQ2448_3355 [Microbotryum intermedium]|uniref:BQ2448_3355 protein n=1 Tax=Microbotryum intermedium TaxID=269621 RepID=A0A238FF21_9BASI|nr:BQ2448_3355 [Microbotryum intermedium]